MENTWILVANAERARCFDRPETGLALTELADFVQSEARADTANTADKLADDQTKGHGRTAHAGTQFEPHTQRQAKARSSFARQLAEYINKGVSEQRCSRLVLIASSPMLGELRPCLSRAADHALRSCVASDLTLYQGTELKQRIDHALQLLN